MRRATIHFRFKDAILGYAVALLSRCWPSVPFG